MEKKTSIWTLNFAFFLSILLHVYIVFFLNDLDINLFKKEERITITLSAIGNIEEAPKESIKKEKIIKKQMPEIKELKKNH